MAGIAARTGNTEGERVGVNVGTCCSGAGVADNLAKGEPDQRRVVLRLCRPEPLQRERQRVPNILAYKGRKAKARTGHLASYSKLALDVVHQLVGRRVQHVAAREGGAALLESLTGKAKPAPS